MSYPEIAHLVVGELVYGSTPSPRTITNPATREVLALLPQDDDALLQRVAKTATIGFRQWKKTPAAKRTEVLKKAASFMRRDVEALARVITLEQGKILQESRNEIFGTATIFEWMADEAQRISSEVLPRREDGFQQSIHHEPIGPMLAIAPWNMPAMMAGRKIAHALATGCSVVVKPASETPGIAMLLAKCLLEAGLPPEAISIVHGNAGRISATLIQSPDIRKISFTGSTEVGRSLGALCGKHIKRFTAELGGHAPVIVLPDADIDMIIPALCGGKFFNAGQSCMAPTRFFVHKKHAAHFAEAFATQAARITVGQGFAADAKMGAMINDAAITSMQHFVDDALAHGAKLLCGGKSGDPQGSFYLPTILADVPASARIMQDEPYGPLAPITSYETVEEAVQRSNALPFGLCGYAFGHDPQALRHIADDLEVGLLGINTLNVGGPMVPFGGVKDSGNGREGSRYGLLEHMTLKAITSNG